ncbi:helix-turn-helix transcriptional regulator [Ligilactobacillus agilis]|uniref:helix-turn-helix domain-containing protein n=1 Tax=Ligilactobacillus agilis TaxID=1601 RepID=UPI0025A38C94|nr:helix-turn-helix transcriptional regulator [Ligilactobacillus agilis]MDM8279675.1 helix-turn-helix transcriptional regulator [Ligilactobacillus agilis]
MKIYDVIREIASTKNISIYKLEHDLNFSNGSISKWNTWSPNAVKLQEVADYLGVTTSFILNEARKEVDG